MYKSSKKKNAVAKVQVQQQQDSNLLNEVSNVDLTKPHSVNELRRKCGLKPVDSPHYEEKLLLFNKG